jgi:hypothetical protein
VISRSKSTSALDDLVEGFADGQNRLSRIQQAAGVFAEAEFFAAAHHAEAGDIAEFAFFDLNPPGKTAPGSASGTLSPALKFFAPQTIWRGLPLPSSTWQTLSLSAFGCCTKDSI